VETPACGGQAKKSRPFLVFILMEAPVSSPSPFPQPEGFRSLVLFFLFSFFQSSARSRIFNWSFDKPFHGDDRTDSSPIHSTSVTSSACHMRTCVRIIIIIIADYHCMLHYSFPCIACLCNVSCVQTLVGYACMYVSMLVCMHNVANAKETVEAKHDQSLCVKFSSIREVKYVAFLIRSKDVKYM
jgi:hypothetical protein